MDWNTLFSSRALKAWKSTYFYWILNVSQTLKHPCVTSSWLSCLYIDLQIMLCQTSLGTFCKMQAYRLFNIKLKNGKGTKSWGTNYKHDSLLSNIVVVPYLDKNHWSLYIMEEGCTIHCDSIPRFHNSRLSKEFAQNVRIAWALSRA
jgi:hypothetical protein